MYQVSFSAKGERFSISPRQISEINSGEIFDGMKPVALVTVHQSSRHDKPVELGFQRIADNSTTELSGHGDSVLLELDVEQTIGMVGWFQDIIATASQNKL